MIFGSVKLTLIKLREGKLRMALFRVLLGGSRASRLLKSAQPLNRPLAVRPRSSLPIGISKRKPRKPVQRASYDAGRAFARSRSSSQTGMRTRIVGLSTPAKVTLSAAAFVHRVVQEPSVAFNQSFAAAPARSRFRAAPRDDFKPFYDPRTGRTITPVSAYSGPVSGGLASSAMVTPTAWQRAAVMNPLDCVERPADSDRIQSVRAGRRSRKKFVKWC